MTTPEQAGQAQEKDDFLQSLIDTLPAGLSQFKADLEAHWANALQNRLDKMNLVPRDEFDAQKAILLRSAERLKACEMKIKALEGQQT